MPVQNTQWYELPAFALESDVMRVVIIPQQGGKIGSILDKRTGREWLIQPTQFPIRSVPYAAPYPDYDMNSWDEMFPTIVECKYPIDGAFKDNYLPDHGEVWAMDWQVIAQSDDTLSVAVDGRALPYTFTRHALLTAPDVINLTYEVTNTGEETLFFMWSAHPLFAVDYQTRIVLPEQVTELINAHDVPPWGAQGKRYAFPHPNTTDDKSWDLQQIGSTDLKDCRKFFVPPDVTVNWGGLRQEDTGGWLKVSWDAKELPYLGIWIDEGTYAKVPTVAIEPMSGYYDSLTTARNNNKVASLAPGSTTEWVVQLQLNDGTSPIHETSIE